MNLNRWCCTNAHHLILIKIILVNPAIGHRNLLQRHRAQPINDGALHLTDRAAHIDNGSNINRNRHLAHFKILIRINIDISDFRDVRGMTKIEGEALTPTCRHGLPPACLCCSELNHVDRAAGIQSINVAITQPTPLTHQLDQKLDMVSPRQH